jgi:hypothetical protein
MRPFFRPTGQRPQWHLVAFLAAGLAAGLAIGLAWPPRGVALLPGLTAGIVAAAGIAGPPALATRLARWAALSTVVVVTLGFVASDRPWLAGAAMAAVAVFTSAAAGLGRVGIAIGSLGTLAYVLSLIVATVTSARGEATVLDVVVRAVTAAAVGFGVAVLGARVRFRAQPQVPVPDVPSPWRPIWRSVRTLDHHARDGVRRAVPLTACVVWYEASGSHDVLWILVTALAVLLPTGKSTWESASARVVATVIGVALVDVVGGVVPTGVLLGVALAAVVAGIAYKPVVPVLADAATAFAVVAFTAAPAADVGTTGVRRLVDTLIGVTIALLATYLLWPRDKPDATTDAADTDDTGTTSTEPDGSVRPEPT